MNHSTHICLPYFLHFHASQVTHIIIHGSITANWHPYLLDDGRLQKAINVNNKMHIIEEMVLFQDGQPVQRIELDTEKVITEPRREEVTSALLRAAHDAG